MSLQLKRCRISAHMTKQTLAQFLGVGASTIANWEAGRTSPNADQIVTLANVLSTDPNTLLGWDDDKHQLTFGDLRAIELLHTLSPEIRSSLADFFSAASAGSGREADVNKPILP